MAYSKTNWNEGTVTKAAHVTIDGTEYPVTPATISGGTPFSVSNMNKIEDGIEANDTANVNNTTSIGTLANLNTTEKSNLVGAINEVNTALGSIVESGSNANGEYIKYSDGTMICTKKVSFTGLQFTTVWGNAYETPPIDLGDYAQEFIDIPVMFVSCAYSTAAPEGLANTKTSYGSVVFYRPIKTDATTYSYTFYLMAIGKWK